MKLTDETNYFASVGVRRFWLTYQKYYMWTPRWTVFAMVANHTAHCRSLGYACSLFNPWEPQKCFKHHELIEAVLQPPFYQLPKFPPRLYLSKVATDWLGIQIECNVGVAQDQPELTRRFECWGLPVGPLPGEDYFETISLLKSVISAEEEFTLVEAGSGIGYWSLKAAKLWRDISPTPRPCHVILIDAQVDMGAAAKHLMKNNIYHLCNVSLFQASASAPLLDRLLNWEINMLHVDIESWEMPLIQQSQLLGRVRRLHVGTHSRKIHRHVKERLSELGFAIEFDYPPRSLARTQYGPVAFDDGILAGDGPSVQKLRDQKSDQQRSLLKRGGVSIRAAGHCENLQTFWVKANRRIQGTGF